MAVVADYTELLLTVDRLSDVTGVTHTVNLPVRDASNPLFPTSAEDPGAWDRDKTYTSVVKDADGWHMFYSGFTTTLVARTGYAFSNDGVTWTKPNLGLVVYDGNTNNNILRAGFCDHAIYDTMSEKWVQVEEESGAGQDIRLYTQDSPTDAPTLAKTLTITTTEPEGKGIVRRPSDGRWVLYYVAGHATESRSIYTVLSDTTDLTGAWTEQGILLASPASTNQYYTAIPSRVSAQAFAVVTRYNSTSEQIWADLFDSVDLSLADANWVDPGAGGTWDDEIVWPSSVVAEDNEWHFYYTGSPEDHSTEDRDGRIGRVTIPRGRIGQVAGAGSITTDPIPVAVGASLVVNALAAGGTLDIEVQNEAGTPLSGFAEADFDTITSDSFDHFPTWAGEPMPTGQTVRLKFVLSSSTVHAFDITNDPFSDDFTGTNGNPWDNSKWDTSAGSGGGTTTIQDNKGRAAGSSGNGNSGGRGIGRQGAVPNQKITGEFTLCQLDEPCRVSVWAQTSNDWNTLDSPTDGYGVFLPADSDTAQLVVVSGGTETVLDTATWPRSVGEKSWELVRAKSKVRFRIWDTGSNPSGWLLSADDTTLLVDTAGTFQVAYACPTAPSVDACVDFDDIDVVEDDNQLPSPGFNVVVSGRRADFADVSSDPDGTITEWAWTFGDGATSTLPNPSHTYAGPGTYTATLTVTDDLGGFDTTSEQVEVASNADMGSFDCSFTASFDVDPACSGGGQRLGGQGAIRKPPRPNPATR